MTAESTCIKHFNNIIAQGNIPQGGRSVDLSNYLENTFQVRTLSSISLAQWFTPLQF